MIKRLTAKNYGCLRDVTVDFGSLHALIGPNDSGKSTILRAIRTLADSARTRSKQPGDSFDSGLHPRTDLSYFVSLEATIQFEGAVEPVTYGAEINEVRLRHGGGISGSSERVATGGVVYEADTQTGPTDLLSQIPEDSAHAYALRVLSNTQYLALTEEGLRKPSGFLPRNELRLSANGGGLPGLYFALRNDREEAFERILHGTRKLFPTVKTVRTQPRSSTDLELEVELVDGTRVGIEQVSAGLLYYLAFAALPELLETQTTLLLEEPENGLHPARIREVLGVLREVTSGGRTQIILATHSPLVINELRPEEVSVVTRTLEEGTKVTPITQTANFEKRSSVYALGELWLSYADGQTEGPLFDPKAR